MMAQQEAAILVEDLVVGFCNRVIIDHLNLAVRGGEILGLVGGSGSGKSVLMRSIIGLLPRTSGRIRVLGVESEFEAEEAQRAIGRRCGVLFQQGALFSSLNVLENVAFPMREHLLIPEQLMHEIARVKLEMVGLDREDENKMPSELSGGMTKRVGLARALALDPEIVFLDEPTSGLDPIAAGEIDVLIRTLQQTLGLTVFMVTHDTQSLANVCDRIAALANGQVIAIGTLPEMLAVKHPWLDAYFHARHSRPATAGTAAPI